MSILMTSIHRRFNTSCMNKLPPLLLLLLCVLLSCHLPSSNSPPKKLRIGFSQCRTQDAWRQTMNEEMRREIGFYQDYDIELIIKDANNQPLKQISDIEELVESGIDILLVSPSEAKKLTPTIGEVYNKGIPVILIDRTIDSKQYTAYIGGNNYEIGLQAAAYAAQLLEKKGNILEISLNLSGTPAFERQQGFLEGLKKYPKINISNSFEGENGQITVAPEALLSSIKSIDLIYAHNDFLAKDAIQWMKEHNIKKPMIIGIDGLSSPGIEMVLNGDLNATFLYPTGGDKAIQLALNILEKKPFEKFNELGTIKIDYHNALTIKHQSNLLREQQSKIDKQRASMGEMAFLLKRQSTFMLLFTLIIFLLLALAAFTYYYLQKKKLAIQLLDKKSQTIRKQNSQITKQRDKLIQVLKIAEEATATKTRFFTDISHEFRHALSLVIHPVNELMAAKEDSTVKEKLRLVQKNTELLSSLSEEILNFEKIESNKYYLDFKLNDLGVLLREIIHSLGGQIQQKGIQIVTSFPEPLEVYMDEPAMKKIIRNLLTNAIKYNKQNGKIRVEVKQINKNVTVSVSDTGLGILEKDMPHVFDRFYRAHQIAASGKDPGTGLGLAICKTLVQLHHGKIKVSSQIGAGTTFYFTIPQNFKLAGLNAKNEIIANEKLLALVNKIRKPKLLIVEDSPELLTIMSNMLSKYYQTITAGNGKEGLDKALNHRPDAILSDIYMPEMDGIELCQQIKLHPALFHIPVILLTAIESAASKIKGFDTGADAYLTKPFNELMLVTQIQNLLRSRKKLKATFSKLLPLNGIQPKEQKEEDFIQQCLLVIHEKISEDQFTLDDLAANMFLSRSSLYRKIKEVTGLKAVDFLKKGKLHYAAKLLLTTDLTVGQIAYSSGFNDKKYFSKCFTKEYGKVPSKFRDLTVER